MWERLIGRPSPRAPCEPPTPLRPPSQPRRLRSASLPPAAPARRHRLGHRCVDAHDAAGQRQISAGSYVGRGSRCKRGSRNLDQLLEGVDHDSRLFRPWTFARRTIRSCQVQPEDRRRRTGVGRHISPFRVPASGGDRWPLGRRTGGRVHHGRAAPTQAGLNAHPLASLEYLERPSGTTHAASHRVVGVGARSRHCGQSDDESDPAHLDPRRPGLCGRQPTRRGSLGPGLQVLPFRGPGRRRRASRLSNRLRGRHRRT